MTDEQIDNYAADYMDGILTRNPFLAQARYALPSHWDIGKVFKRLILGIAREKACSILPDQLFTPFIT